MKITAVTTHVLLDPGYRIGATSSAQDDIIVLIHTDEGLVGVGEADVNPWMADAAIRAPSTHTMGRGLTDMLIGENPLDVERLWQKLYVGSAMNGRRGLVVHALGAIDMALHDLRGKILQKPCYELLGGDEPARTRIQPYASLQPEVDTIQAYQREMVAWAVRAKARGFRAAKLEMTFGGPYAHMGLVGPPEWMTETVAAVREAVGPDFVLMADVQYAFSSVTECLDVLSTWEPYDLFFVETPLWPDDLDDYRRLCAESPIPIAAGEWLATRFEFAELIAHGIHVVQPDIGRVGGLTEAQRVCDLARAKKRPVVPHIWKTGISIAAGLHLAARNPHCRYIEYLPGDLCESALRKRLLIKDFALVDGALEVPSGPGLGIDIDVESVKEFEAVARRVRVH